MNKYKRMQQGIALIVRKSMKEKGYRIIDLSFVTSLPIQLISDIVLGKAELQKDEVIALEHHLDIKIMR